MTTATKRQPHATVEDIDAALAANGTGESAAPVNPPAPHKARRRAAAAVTKNETSAAADVAPPVKPYTLQSFTTRDVPWAKIGKIDDEALTAADAAHAGGLDFEVELLDAGFRSSAPVHEGESPWRTVGHRRACVHRDTQQFFSFVSADYTPVQYGDAFSFMDEISSRYVGAGMFGGGRQGFMVVRLPERGSYEVKVGRRVDPLDLYVVLRTSHDLTRAIEVSTLMLRGKCMNALTLSSFTANAEQRWSVKHIGQDPMLKLKAATATLTRTDAYVDAFLRTARTLAETKIELEEAHELLRRVLPDRPKRDEQVGAIVHAWRESPTNGFPDNGWGLVNAVSEYFEWGRNEGTRTAQSRFTGGLTGSTHKYTNRTTQLLLQRRR